MRTGGERRSDDRSLSPVERIARNEAIFREINESIARGQWPGDPQEPIAFRCECGILSCNMLVEVAADDYERIRSDPRRFLLVRGHEITAVEDVVDDDAAADYVVVEKIGEAGDVARETDPR
ncbi:MAG TPA: hypothetical protein VKS25_14955 [Solirubrobacteraceae bacterium]|nr:hypothetical protein [Solirubrobacteraceae bacterium]